MYGQRKSPSDWLHLMTASQVLWLWFWSFSPLTGLASCPSPPPSTKLPWKPGHSLLGKPLGRRRGRAWLSSQKAEPRSGRAQVPAQQLPAPSCLLGAAPELRVSCASAPFAGVTQPAVSPARISLERGLSTCALALRQRVALVLRPRWQWPRPPAE